MHDRIDAIFPDHGPNELLIPDAADDERNEAWQGRTEAGRKIVEDDDFLASVMKFMYQMAADIAATAGYQDRHRESSPYVTAKASGRM
jgi:hypothetical protein